MKIVYMTTKEYKVLYNEITSTYRWVSTNGDKHSHDDFDFAFEAINDAHKVLEL